MSGKSRNMEVGAQGGDITLDASFREYDGGNLVDTDTIPTYIIYDPNSVVKQTGSATWVSTGYYTVTYSIAVDAEISDEWRIAWSAAINGSTVPDSSEYFEVVIAGSIEFGDEVIITDAYLNEIKTVIAYPSVETIILTDAQIKSLCIAKALRAYFVKFPLKVTEEHVLNSNSETSIDFPDINTYGVVDARVVGKTGTGSQGTGFWDLVFHNSNSRISGTGSYGVPGYNPSFSKQMNQMRRQANSTVSNMGTIHTRIDLANKILYMMSTVGGKANVTWAKYSYNFSNVKFEYIEDVIKLSQANLLKQFADTTSIVEAGGDVSINYSELKSRADELESSVMEKWNEIPDILLLRVS